MQKAKETISFGDKIDNFVKNNRKVILTTLSILVILFVGTITFIFISDATEKREIEEVEELNTRFEALLPVQHRNFLEAEDFHSHDIDVLLADLETFLEKSSIFTRGMGFARSRAWFITAQIHSGREDWSLAESAWISSAQAGARTYLAPLALFNGAAAAEEQGNLEQAIELLQQSISGSFEFPMAARAQFSIGRLYEQQGNIPAAIEAYRAVLINWPNMPVFPNMARSRIISLELE